LVSGAAERKKKGLAFAHAARRRLSSAVKGVFFTSRAVKLRLRAVTIWMCSAGDATPARRSVPTTVTRALSISRGGVCSRRMTFRIPFSVRREK
jgi:hypothetical protein